MDNKVCSHWCWVVLQQMQNLLKTAHPVCMVYCFCFSRTAWGRDYFQASFTLALSNRNSIEYDFKPKHGKHFQYVLIKILKLNFDPIVRYFHTNLVNSRNDCFGHFIVQVPRSVLKLKKYISGWDDKKWTK